MIPSNVKQLQIEAEFAEHINIADKDYAGAEIISDCNGLLTNADIVLSLQKLNSEELGLLRNKVAISFLDPFNSYNYVERILSLNITSFSMEMSTRCQKEDELSSQASLAGLCYGQ